MPTNTEDAAQTALNGITLETDLRRAVGARNADELRNAIRRSGVEVERAELVSAASVEALGFPVPTGLRFLSDATARAVLPIGFFPAEVEGVTFPAPRRLPVESVRYHSREAVEAVRAALEATRAEDAARREAERQATAERRRAWLDAEPGVYLTSDDLTLAEDVRDRVSSRSTVEPARLGPSNFGREYPADAVEAGGLTPDERSVYDERAGAWVLVAP